MPGSTLRGRVGLVVPPSNPTVEPELYRLLSDSVDVYATRLPVLPDLPLADRLTHYVDDLGPALESLQGLDLGASLFACTGSTYPMGADDEERLTASASAAAGFPVHTAAASLGEVFGLLGVRALRIVTPYPDWLSEQCGSYWSVRGLEKVSQTQVRGSDAIYDLSSDQVLDALDEALALEEQQPSEPYSTAVVVVGTGAASLRALELRAPTSSLPLVSSNVAGAWRLLRSVGVDPATSGSPALRRLAEHIDLASARAAAQTGEVSR